MTNRRGGGRAVLVRLGVILTVLHGLPGAGLPAALEILPARGDGSPFSTLLARYELVLLYRPQADDHARAIVPYLQDLAEVFGAEGLAVALAGAPDGASWLPRGGNLHRLREAPDVAGQAILVLVRRDGVVLAAMERAAVDLYAVWRLCERQLRGRSRLTLSEQVRQALTAQLAAGALTERLDGSGGLLLADLLREYPRGCLFLPPGCGSCLLAKYEPALAALFARQARLAVLVCDPDAAEGLSRLGWRGPSYLLPAGAETRLLQLRQTGHYLPLLVTWSDQTGVQVKTLKRGE